METPRHAECPVFPDITDFALTFLIELPLEDSSRKERPRAFRLESIHRAIAPPNDDENHHLFPAYDALVEPVRSYLDDVTNGGPGRGGRPLIFLAQPQKIVAEGKDDPRTLTVRCEADWRYKSEGRKMPMRTVDGQAREIQLRYRDSFCLFESGRLFYCFSMFPMEERRGAGVDEYMLIAMQQLAMSNPDRDVLNAWSFALKGEKEGTSLPAMAKRRLDDMAADASGGLNGLRCYLKDTLGINPSFDIRQEHVRNLLMTVEDDRLLRIATFAGGSEGKSSLTDEEPWSFASRLTDDEKVRSFASGLAATRPICPDGCEPHYPAEAKEELLPFLALAGTLQSVFDFPFQDPAEIHDATRPVVKGGGYFNYAHPRYHVEITDDSRSMHDARLAIGNCPYLMLTWLVAVHDELMVTAIEEAVDELIYGKKGERALIAEPLGPLAGALAAIAWPLPSPIGELRQNLNDRFDLFRRYAINRSSHLFRYEKEREALAAVQAGMGNRDRFDRAQQMIDRIEGLIEDMHALNGAYNGVRMGRMLLFITVLGLFNFYDQLTGSMAKLADMGLLKQVEFGLLIVALIAVICFPAERIGLGSRIRRSGARLLRIGGARADQLSRDLKSS